LAAGKLAVAERRALSMMAEARHDRPVFLVDDDVGCQVVMV
jgi:hypothetical protein